MASYLTIRHGLDLEGTLCGDALVTPEPLPHQALGYPDGLGKRLLRQLAGFKIVGEMHRPKLPEVVIQVNTGARCVAITAGINLGRMSEPDRTPLEPWQIEDAKVLKRLYNERTTMSQELFGATYGIGTQGAVWQFLNGRRALNLRAAAAFARGLNCSIMDFSPTLAAQLSVGNQDALKVAEVYDLLPPKAQARVLDFLRYQLQTAAPTPQLEERRGEYVVDLQAIEQRITPSAPQDQEP